MNIVDKHVHKHFGDWFKEYIGKDVNAHVSDDIKFLSRGPLTFARRFSAYNINGYSFRTLEREQNLRTQNSGVCITSETISYASSRDRNPIHGEVLYYGKIVDIIELNYYGQHKVVLFKCIWVDTQHIKKNNMQFTIVNFSRLIHIGAHEDDEPYIFASDAEMVYYVEDKSDPLWSVAIRVKPRDLYEMGDDGETEQLDVIVDDDLDSSFFPDDINSLQLIRESDNVFSGELSTNSDGEDDDNEIDMDAT